MDVVNAVNVQNVILPSGTAKIGRTEYNIGLNGTPSLVDALNQIPLKVVAGGNYLHAGCRPRARRVRRTAEYRAAGWAKRCSACSAEVRRRFRRNWS